MRDSIYQRKITIFNSVFYLKHLWHTSGHSTERFGEGNREVSDRKDFCSSKRKILGHRIFPTAEFFTPHEAIANWMGLDGCYRSLSIGGMGDVGGGRDRMSSTQMRTPWQAWTSIHAPWPSMYTMVFNGHGHLHRAYLPSSRVFMDMYSCIHAPCLR